MNDQQNDPFDELMRRSLANEAAGIEPADGLHEIQDRVRRQRGPISRRPWVLTASAAVIGTAAAIGAFTVLSNDNKNAGDTEVGGPATDSTSAAGPALESRTPASSPAPIETPQSKPIPRGKPEAVTSAAVPVYWLGRTVGVDTGSGMRLYRTYSKINGRPAEEAVRLMTSRKADDPDYESPWSGAVVSSVIRSDELVTVDFKALPRQKLEPGLANLAVQQLVYTVQGALGDQTIPVRITERGQVGSALFGVVDTRQPMSRAQATDVRALVWILSPTNGAVATMPVTISGTAAAFEAQVNWKVTNLQTKVTQSGYTSAKQGQRFSAFSFRPKLGSGEWLIEAYLISPQDGHTTDTDSKTIYVK